MRCGSLIAIRQSDRDRRNDDRQRLDVTAGSSALFQVFLVIFFRRPKCLRGNHLGDNGLGVFMFRRQARDGRGRCLLLFRR